MWKVETSVPRMLELYVFVYLCVCVRERERERAYLGTKFPNGYILCSSTSPLQSVDSRVESDYSSSWKESTESRNVSTNPVEVVPTACVSKCVCVCVCDFYPKTNIALTRRITSSFRNKKSFEVFSLLDLFITSLTKPYLWTKTTIKLNQHTFTRKQNHFRTVDSSRTSKTYGFLFLLSFLVISSNT
jgi:hypothetical protein